MSYTSPEPFEAVPAEPSVSEGLPMAEPMDGIVHRRSATEWLKAHRMKFALGAAAVSTAVTFALNPVEPMLKTFEEEFPPVLGGMVAMEAMWIGGAAMMLGGVGKKVGNPLKIHSKIPEIAAAANTSRLFKSGLAINTAGAVGEFIIPAVAVGAHLPPEAWGILAPSTIDLGITCMVRAAIYNGMKRHGTTSQE